MKILLVGGDTKPHEIVEHINNFSEKERGIIIVSTGHIDMGNIIAKEIMHTLDMPLIAIDHTVLQQHETSLDTILSQVSEDKRQELVLKIEKMIADATLEESYVDAIRMRDISAKKQQEKLRRRHYTSGKVSKKKKG